MLNYFQRIDSFKQRNYFQVNGQFLDIYGPKLHEWAQSLDTVKDILQYASSINIADHYDILSIRIIADYQPVDKAALMDSIITANQLLAEELGESVTWAEIKQEGSPKRHFLTTTFVSNNPLSVFESTKQDEPTETTQRKPKVIRSTSSDKESV